MGTIAEILQKWERNALYEQAASNDALKSNYQKFILHSNITALALLKSELIQVASRAAPPHRTGHAASVRQGNWF